MSGRKNRDHIYIEPEADGAEKLYFPLAQSHASNSLQKKLTSKIEDPEQCDLIGNATIIYDDIRLYINDYRQRDGVSQSAAMLLDSLMIMATIDGLRSTLVRLPINEYMAIRGLKNVKEARAQARRDIDALERVKFEYRGTGRQREQWLKVSISGGTVGQTHRGDILFRFNEDFFDIFKVSERNKYIFMYFPREALYGNIRCHPHKYWLARKISEHKRMNLGKSNEDIISVATLLDACPTLPTYEEVMATGRAVRQRILSPFERDLDALRNSFAWEYIGLNEADMDYKSFVKATIKISWVAYPDTTNLGEEKAKRSKRAKKRG